mgnify:CR=1 FL=1
MERDRPLWVERMQFDGILYCAARKAGRRVPRHDGFMQERQSARWPEIGCAETNVRWCGKAAALRRAVGEGAFVEVFGAVGERGQRW